MDGQDLRRMADSAGLGAVEICHEAGISTPTLYKVYNDKHTLKATRVKVEAAIKRLAEKFNRAVS
jgi:predicted transcriptional regulator